MKANQKVNEGIILAATITFKNVFHTAVLVSYKNNIPNQMCCSSARWKYQTQTMYSLVMEVTGLPTCIFSKCELYQYLAGSLADHHSWFNKHRECLNFCHLVLDYIYANSMLQCQEFLKQQLPELRMPLKTAF